MKIHVRFEGRSFDLEGRELQLNTNAHDGDIRAGLARYMDISLNRLDGYVVDRRPGGTVVVRPEAVYG